MKKPDRFERMVRKWFARIPQGKLIAIEPEVAKLLRLEHAWFRRMVKAELCSAQQAAIQAKSTPQAYGHRCREAQCQDILGRLKQRRK